MQWNSKPRSNIDQIKTRFAIFPVKVEEKWVWLETYYVVSWQYLDTTFVCRFLNYQDAVAYIRGSEA